MRIFTGNAHPDLAHRICKYLGIDLGRAEVGKFPDSETKVQILDNVRGMDVFVVQSLTPPVNESIMELLVMVDALRRAAARSINAVIPYYAYARQDRKHAGRVPITAKLVANLLATSGVSRVLTMDLHAMQIQGFFDIPLDHLLARPVLIDYLKTLNMDKPVVLSPDIGSMKMGESFALRIDASLAVVEKKRLGDADIKTGHVIGEIRNCDVVIPDDMITTAGSICAAIKIAKSHGAKRVIAMATHGVFAGPAFDRLREAGPDEIVVTDTIPLRQEAPAGLKLTRLSVAELLGEAITRIHRNKSVSVLF